MNGIGLRTMTLRNVFPHGLIFFTCKWLQIVTVVSALRKMSQPFQFCLRLTNFLPLIACPIATHWAKFTERARFFSLPWRNPGATETRESSEMDFFVARLLCFAVLLWITLVCIRTSQCWAQKFWAEICCDLILKPSISRYKEMVKLELKELGILWGNQIHSLRLRWDIIVFKSMRKQPPTKPKPFLN